MMEAFSTLRQFLYGVRKRYFPKRIPQTISFASGLPGGITPDILTDICQEYFGEKPCSFSNQHLSGWKPSGAYRLQIRTVSGNLKYLIYKESHYTPDHIPALINIPVHPGPPEYAVFHQPVGALAPYLPRVYLAEELAPRTHYRFLLEDLGHEYRRIHHFEDILHTCEQLPRLHQALSEWTKEIKPSKLIHYGKEVSQALQEYARESFERHRQQSEDPALKSVLACWPKISKTHLLPEFFELQPVQPIHGDTNYTNIHIHKQDPFQFKIVDWEWAGYGMPHADLASLIKGMPEDLEKHALRKFLGSPGKPNPGINSSLTFEQNRRQYYWCQLERGLLDAAFLTNQYLNSVHPAYFSLPEAISRSLRQVLSACQKLGA